MIERSYIFSYVELAILLRIAGVDSCYGLASDENEIGLNEANNTLIRLIRNNVVNVYDDRLEISAEYTTVISDISNAEYTVLFHSDGWMKEKVMYVGQKIILCQPNIHQPKYNVVSTIENEKLEGIVCDRDILDTNQEEANMLLFREEYEKHTIDTVAVTEIINNKTKDIKNISIGKLDLSICIVDNDNRVINYSRDNYKKILDEYTGGMIIW